MLWLKFFQMPPRHTAPNRTPNFGAEFGPERAEYTNHWWSPDHLDEALGKHTFQYKYQRMKERGEVPKIIEGGPLDFKTEMEFERNNTWCKFCLSMLDPGLISEEDPMKYACPGCGAPGEKDGFEVPFYVRAEPSCWRKDCTWRRPFGVGRPASGVILVGT